MKNLSTHLLLAILLFSCAKPGESDETTVPAQPGSTVTNPQPEGENQGANLNPTPTPNPIPRNTTPEKPSVANNGSVPDTNAGRGFDTKTQNQMQHCLGGKISLDSDKSGSSSGFQRVTTVEQLKERLSFGSGESVNQGVLTSDIAKSHLSALVDTELTSTYNFVNTYILGTKRIDDIFFRVQTANMDIFTKNCGDSYMNGILVGGVYVASVKFAFSSKEAKDSFNFDFDLNKRGNRYEIEKSKIAEGELKNITMEISTMQIGGGGKPGPNYRIGAALKCDLQNDNPCTSILKTIGEYGNSEFHDAIVAAPAVLSFGTRPYPL